MIKHIISLILFLSIFNLPFAKSQYMYGIAGGVNLAFPYGLPHYDIGNKKIQPLPRPTFSFLLKGRKNDKNNFGFGMRYIQASYKDKSYFGSLGAHSIQDALITFSYLGWSPFFEHTFGNKTHFNLTMGPSIDLIVYKGIKGTATTVFNDGSYMHTSFYPGKVKTEDPELDIRANAGIGLEIPLQNNWNLTVENSLSMGLINGKILTGHLDSKTIDLIIQIGLLKKMESPSKE